MSFVSEATLEKDLRRGRRRQRRNVMIAACTSVAKKMGQVASTSLLESGREEGRVDQRRLRQLLIGRKETRRKVSTPRSAKRDVEKSGVTVTVI